MSLSASLSTEGEDKDDASLGAQLSTEADQVQQSLDGHRRLHIEELQMCLHSAAQEHVSISLGLKRLPVAEVPTPPLHQPTNPGTSRKLRTSRFIGRMFRESMPWWQIPPINCGSDLEEEKSADWWRNKGKLCQDGWVNFDPQLLAHDGLIFYRIVFRINYWFE